MYIYYIKAKRPAEMQLSVYPPLLRVGHGRRACHGFIFFAHLLLQEDLAIGNDYARRQITAIPIYNPEQKLNATRRYKCVLPSRVHIIRHDQLLITDLIFN